ncbi:MAG: hypothetical protein HOK85_05365 [Euryarchaeota archaeon]|jgi:hypothetical protein|nr:hypothetical protein [Euryarchaeota archaeon]
MENKWIKPLIIGGFIFVFAFATVINSSSSQSGNDGEGGFEEVSRGESGQFETGDPPRQWIHVFFNNIQPNCTYGDPIEFELVNSSGVSMVPEDWVCEESEEKLLMTITLNRTQETFDYTSNHEMRVYTADISAREIDQIRESSSVNGGLGCYGMCCGLLFLLYGGVKGFKEIRQPALTTTNPMLSEKESSKTSKKAKSNFYMPAPPPKAVKETPDNVGATTSEAPVLKSSPEPEQSSIPWENIENVNE